MSKLAGQKVKKTVQNNSKTLSVTKLKELFEKTSTRKIKNKIKVELDQRASKRLSKSK